MLKAKVAWSRGRLLMRALHLRLSSIPGPLAIRIIRIATRLVPGAKSRLSFDHRPLQRRLTALSRRRSASRPTLLRGSDASSRFGTVDGMINSAHR
jgi:hypothetical protein